MGKLRPGKPSASMIVALIALVMAMGGTSYAMTLGKNSVGSKQLKKNAVTTKKIKNHAVTAAKINPTGLTVPHATTAGSAPLPSTLPAGETERGSFGAIADVTSSGKGAASEVSWPIPLASDPIVHVILAGDPPPTGCSGSVSNPGAASGNLCIFLAFQGSASGTVVTLNPEDNANGEAGKSGAMIYDNSSGAGRNDFWGDFAVTG